MLFRSLELRIDYLADVDEQDIKTLASTVKGQKVILTYRAKWEGGQFNGTEKERITLLKCALKERFTFVDVELATLQKNNLHFTKSERSKLLVSYHNFEKTPSLKSLDAIKKKMLTYNPAVIKIATNVTQQKDLATLTTFLLETVAEGTKAIVIGMGEIGAVTRIFFPFIGSEATYASTAKQTASGQLSRERMLEILATDETQMKHGFSN